MNRWGLLLFKPPQEDMKSSTYLPRVRGSNIISKCILLGPAIVLTGTWLYILAYSDILGRFTGVLYLKDMRVNSRDITMADQWCFSKLLVKLYPVFQFSSSSIRTEDIPCFVKWSTLQLCEKFSTAFRSAYSQERNSYLHWNFNIFLSEYFRSQLANLSKD